MAPSPIKLGFAGAAIIGFGAASIWIPAAAAGQARIPAAESDPLQVVADVVLIESQCRQLGVDYGRLFAYAASNGIRPVDILPTGERRAAFDAASRRRARETRGDALCADLAAARDAVIPGVFTAR